MLNLDSGLLCLVRTEKIQKSNLLIYSYLQWRAPTASGDGIINTADRWNAAKRTELIIICVAAELAAVSQRATATSNICIYISYHVGHSVRDWSVFFAFVQRQTRPTTFSVGNAIRNITVIADDASSGNKEVWKGNVLQICSMSSQTNN